MRPVEHPRRSRGAARSPTGTWFAADVFGHIAAMHLHVSVMFVGVSVSRLLDYMLVVPAS